MKEVKSAHYIHCFAHQLQLALVFVAKNHPNINDFFDLISRLLNMLGSSYKHRDNLREKQATKVVEALATSFFYFIFLLFYGDLYIFFANLFFVNFR